MQLAYNVIMFMPGNDQILGKPKVKGGVKRALHLNSDLHISKKQKSESDAKKLADIMRQCGTILKDRKSVV